MFFYVFFCNIIKVNLFNLFNCFVILLHLIFSSLYTRSLLVPYGYVSIESIDLILLSSFELKAVLLISSVKTSYFPLLNLCYVFNLSLIFFKNSLWLIRRLSVLRLLFSDGLFYFLSWSTSKHCLYCSIFSLSSTVFCAFGFFIFTTIIY